MSNYKSGFIYEGLFVIELIGLCTDICVISNSIKMCQINVVNY